MTSCASEAPPPEGTPPSPVPHEAPHTRPRAARASSAVQVSSAASHRLQVERAIKGHVPSSTRGRAYLMCFERKDGIFSMSNEATGRTVLSVASGLMMRPLFRPFFLMYTQIARVTSVRGITFLPQIAARAGDSVFGAKIPLPAFFMAAAFFAPGDFFTVFFAFGAAFFAAFFAAFLAAIARTHTKV